jgi:hypothetical protein
MGVPAYHRPTPKHKVAKVDLGKPLSSAVVALDHRACVGRVLRASSCAWNITAVTPTSVIGLWIGAEKPPE